jgi:hypothetical protein
LIWKKQLRAERNGSAFFTIPSSVDLHFYTDAAGLPGTEVYVATGLAFMSVLDHVIPLTTPAMLSGGTYWVSVAGSVTGFDFFWDGRSITNNGFATGASASFLFVLCRACSRIHKRLRLAR